MTEWLYNTDIDPLAYHGFIYVITNETTGRQYVGRKYVWVERKGKIVKEADWQSYWGSCPSLMEDIKALGKRCFKREIIQWCISRAETNFAEVEHQFKMDVLKALLPDGTPAFYNRNIMSKFFSRTVDSYRCPIYRAKQSKAIAKAIAEKGHPMTGKVHPNKGKKINSGHQKARGRVAITDGVTTKRIAKGLPLPDGWHFGMTKAKPPTHPSRIAYDASPKKCTICAESIPFDQRVNQTCSKVCGDVAANNLKRGRLSPQRLAYNSNPKPCAYCGEPLRYETHKTVRTCSMPCRSALRQSVDPR